MKQKKQSSLARILGYAGGHRNLTLLAVSSPPCPQYWG